MINTPLDKSIYIITEYYKNNLNPYFECLADNVLWLGPAEKQEIRGKENVIKAFSSDKHELTFSMGSIKSTLIEINKKAVEVILQYEIYTNYPNGDTDRHDQRTQFSWINKNDKWQAMVVHVSNEWKYDERDTIYPNHYQQQGLPIRLIEKQDYYLILKADDLSIYHIPINDLLYVETVKRSNKLAVHTIKNTLKINGSLKDFLEKHNEHLLRIHAAYLINPSNVTKIERFKVYLKDGTMLPIPEKKYTQIKKEILQKNKSI